MPILLQRPIHKQPMARAEALCIAYCALFPFAVVTSAQRGVSQRHSGSLTLNNNYQGTAYQGPLIETTSHRIITAL